MKKLKNGRPRKCTWLQDEPFEQLHARVEAAEAPFVVYVDRELTLPARFELGRLRIKCEHFATFEEMEANLAARGTAVPITPQSRAYIYTLHEVANR